VRAAYAVQTAVNGGYELLIFVLRAAHSRDRVATRYRSAGFNLRFFSSLSGFGPHRLLWQDQTSVCRQVKLTYEIVGVDMDHVHGLCHHYGGKKRCTVEEPEPASSHRLLRKLLNLSDMAALRLTHMVTRENSRRDPCPTQPKQAALSSRVWSDLAQVVRRKWAPMSTARGSLDSLPACLGVRIRRGLWRVLCWEVGVVERRSEEQGVEAGSSATQLAVGSQSCLFCVSRTHPV
jgi:hypothetical protein